jgi:hypothetical protein
VGLPWEGMVVVVSEHSVDLLWLPLGAGGPTPLVRWSGRAYEHLTARRDRRRPQRLFHAGLEVVSDGARYTVEMTPRWGVPAAERGVAVSGPVLLATLGRSRFFQYEVRRWRDGVIPDRAFAVDSPVRLSADGERAKALLDAVPRCPAHIWGRDELGVGEMWNSNSIIAWVLAVSGHDLREVRPPQGGRAPGWAAGLAAAGS